MNGYPWAKFYFRDWLSESGLKLCGYAARGLWIDLLATMYDLERPGYLQIAGKPVTLEQIAQLRGGTPAEVRRLLGELDRAGVLSRDESGVIYSRRMVRDARERDTTAERVKRWREKQKAGTGKTVTRNAPCNGKRNSGGAGRHVTCNGEKQKQKQTGRHTHTEKGKPPTLEEVQAEAARIGQPPKQAQRFFAYWQERDWQRDGQPILWRQSLATWTPRGSERSGKHGSNADRKPQSTERTPRQREGWQIEKDIELVTREKESIRQRMINTTRQRSGALTHADVTRQWRQYAKPEDVKEYEAARARLKALEAELRQFATLPTR